MPTPRTLALSADDLSVIVACLSLRHAPLGCDHCSVQVADLIDEWSELEGEDLDQARTHAADLHLRLQAVIDEHDPLHP